MHLGCSVQGEIREDKDALDAIEAVLPAGTLSGAPKIRACQLIGALENSKRGIYEAVPSVISTLPETWIPASPSGLRTRKTAEYL